VAARFPGVIMRAEIVPVDRLDIPEVLIGVSILAMMVWAAYNWTHRNELRRK
jgi:hypothetical protein